MTIQAQKWISPKLLADGLQVGKYRENEEMLERRCGTCNDYWPADSEFFHADKSNLDGLSWQCRACCQERRSKAKSSKRAVNQSKKGSEQAMSGTREDILALVRQKPGLRAVQISDLLDIEPEIVQSFLLMAVRDRQLVEEPATAPNGTACVTYRVDPSYLGWKATPTVAPKVVAGSTAAAGAEAPPQAVTIPPPQIGVKLTKVEIAVKHLAQHGPTHANLLKKVMGVINNAAVRQHLQAATRNGKIIRLGDVFCLPGQEDQGASADAASAEQPDMVHTPAHYTAGGMELIEILRAKMSPEEFRGFLKGNVIKYTIRAEHKNGAEDYQKAGVYASWLAEHSKQQLNPTHI